MNKTLHEEVDRLAGTNDHYEYLERVIDSTEFEQETTIQLRTQLDEIRNRLKDENLYLAIVGEAATGKSTFINALMREELLAAQALTMTTATSTVIGHGQDLAAEFRFRPGTIKSNKLLTHLATTYGKKGSRLNHEPYRAFSTEIDRKVVNTEIIRLTSKDEPIRLPAESVPDEVPYYETVIIGSDISGRAHSKNKVEIALSLRQLVQLFTTADEIASSLVGMTVTHNAEFLKEGVCVIDTPGADATNPLHVQVARDTVAQCDAAIIITPAKQIVSDMLIKLIKNDLDIVPFLHRCIFLVTGIDLIREDERAKILQGVSTRLRRGLQLDSLPPVWVVSAQSLVDGFSGVNPIVQDNKERKYWCTRFVALETDIKKHLQRQRALIVAEKLLCLIDDLFEALNVHLSELRDRYSNQSRALEEAIIPDLDAFAEGQHQECHERMTHAIDEARMWIDSTVNRKRDNLLKLIKKKIYAQDSLEQLRSFVASGLMETVTDSQKKIKKDVDSYFDSLLSEARAINKKFDQCFSQAYQRLCLIDGDIESQSTLKKIALKEKHIAESVSDSEAFSGPSQGEHLGGGVGGLVIGFILGGPMGAFLGGVIGSQIVRVFGPSLDERKEQLWKEIRPTLVEQYSDIRVHLQAEADRYGEQLMTNVQKRINEHSEQYSKTVKQMRAEQRREAKRLNQAQKQIDTDTKQLVKRQRKVQTQRNALRSLGQ
jgi:GTPase Era involved in 16S rRNA processing/gas vesicle protein